LIEGPYGHADRPCRLTSPHGQRQERLSHAHEIAPPSRSPHYAARTLVGGAFSGEEMNGETVAGKGEMITRLAEKRKCSGRSAYGAERLNAPFLVVGLHATIVLAVGSPAVQDVVRDLTIHRHEYCH